ncbi:hypothetical protein DNTS_022041 [Danionella cerebrum]|uniref:Ferric-chelate reductase 1 n=1 Tax=Danionella cerebrum TaxID=2873325 RepID=A0A553R0X0_9TELE|nr:hypothetical protein DNTS_022041 [Danionella translucida]
MGVKPFTTSYSGFMNFLRMLLFALLSCAGIVDGYSNGLLSGVCGSMMPFHQKNGTAAYIPQNVTAPYNITVDKNSFKEGDVITVTINGQSGSLFRGFLLEARQVGQLIPIGTFNVTANDTQTLSCDGVTSRAVSHTTAVKKSLVQVTWMAPSYGPLSNIEFKATILKSFSNFWLNVTSSTVLYNGTDSFSTTAPPVSADPDCGRTKVCFSHPSNCDPNTNANCYYVAIKATIDKPEKRIEIIGKADGYVSIGFSDDQSMGNDDVYICGKNSNGTIGVQHAFNTGKSSPTILPLGNVTNIVAAITNGNINCSFTSRNIQLHTNKYVSSTKVNLLSPSVVGTTNSEDFPPIVKAHGCLMLIAWMTTGNLGMLIARYLKGVAKGQCCAGKDFWFVTHVFLMSLSIIATAIAFIIVFSNAKDWSGGAHPVLGCLVMILSLIQPIVAAFRCDPLHERRFVFNWAHTFLALAIKGLAVAAIFTGLGLLEENKDGWMMKVMGGFVAWEAVMYVLQDLNLRAKKKDSNMCICGYMKPEVVMLFLYLLGNLAFLVALLMWLFVVLSCVGIVDGYADGSVSSVCGTMMPNHGVPAQSSTPPFSVTAGKSTFKEGDVITVTLSGLSGNQFEGFLLEARQVGQNNPIGTFTVTTEAQTLSCNGAAKAVSHTSSSKKSSVQVTWTAPSSGALGNIEFVSTFVKTGKIFWINVKSSAAAYTGTASSSSSSTSTPPVASNPDCGVTKVCFSEPNNCDPKTNTDCYFVAVQSSSNQSEKRIEIIGKADGYVAIGFSDDQSMGNVTNIVTAITNGIINCSFTSRNAISTASRASTDEYYLMIAAGSSSGGNIQFHSNKFVSSTKINLLSPGVVTSSGEAYPSIVKAHGCLMLIAWMTTGSLGMLIARYLKGVAKDQGCFGKDFWFVAHVFLMSLSVTATAIAFILVFSYAQDWSGGAHPVLGCLVMILSLIQPTIAAFRCDPQNERRFIFNWAHSFIALGVKGLAVAAIFTGLALFEENDGDGWMMKVMGDSELCRCGSIKPEVALLVLFLLGNLAFLISLLVGIGMA